MTSNLQTPTYFSEETLAKWVETLNEPEFVRAQRKSAFQLFLDLPWPHSKMEEWRRTKISHIDFESFTFPEGPPAFAPIQKEETENFSGVLTFEGIHCREAKISPELAEKGVYFAPLAQAIQEKPDLVEKHFMKKVPAGEGKFQALHGTFWTHGWILYIPKNLEIKKPFKVVSEEVGQKQATFPHILAVVETNSWACAVHWVKNSPDDEVFRNGVIEFDVADNAEFRYYEMQDLSPSSLNFWNGRGFVQRDGRLKSLFGNFGSSLTKSRYEVELQGKGSDARLHGIYFLSGNQHFDQKTLQYHRVGNTTSDLLYRGAFRGKSYGVYQGRIKVDPDAQKIDSYQTNNNLILEEKARADSIPGLEIEADDVRCSHGATLSKIDEVQLFYLASRGIDREQGKNLLVLGFFEEVLENVPFQMVVDFYRAIAKKLEIDFSETDFLTLAE